MVKRYPWKDVRRSTPERYEEMRMEAEIEKLRADLKEAQEENARLKQERLIGACADDEEGRTVCPSVMQMEIREGDVRKDLAAAEKEIERLQEALTRLLMHDQHLCTAAEEQDRAFARLLIPEIEGCHPTGQGELNDAEVKALQEGGFFEETTEEEIEKIAQIRKASEESQREQADETPLKPDAPKNLIVKEDKQR